MLSTCVASAAPAEQVHKVSVRTHSGVEAGTEQWKPTIDHLTNTIPGHRFEMVAYPHLEQQLEDARNKKFEFVFTNPATYVELQHSAGAKALATLINKRHGTPQNQFGSVIFVRADRDDIVSLKDLKGKHLKAVSELAFGGWRVAWLEMQHAGFSPYTELGQLSFADGNQPAVVTAVKNGEADAGVVRTDMLERLHREGAISLTEFRILHNKDTQGFPFFHSTPLYPEWPFAVMPGVDKDLTAKVKQALLTVDVKHAAAIKGKYIGWSEPLDYQGVDTLLEQLHIGPYQQNKNPGFNFHYLYPIGILLLLLVIATVRKKSSAK